MSKIERLLSGTSLVNRIRSETESGVVLSVKKSDSRWRKFVSQHGNRCAEIDALPPPALRRRVQTAIERHIPAEQWEKLQQVEAIEKETFNQLIEAIPVTS